MATRSLTTELAWLAPRVEDLQRRVEASCQAYLAQTAPKR